MTMHYTTLPRVEPWQGLPCESKAEEQANAYIAIRRRLSDLYHPGSREKPYDCDDYGEALEIVTGWPGELQALFIEWVFDARSSNGKTLRQAVEKLNEYPLEEMDGFMDWLYSGEWIQWALGFAPEGVPIF